MEILPLISFGVLFFLAFGGLAGAPPETALFFVRDKKWRAKGPRAGAAESRAGTSAARDTCAGWMSMLEGAVKATCAAGREKESGESFGVSTDRASDCRRRNAGAAVHTVTSCRERAAHRSGGSHCGWERVQRQVMPAT
eukprot:10613175-Ditylum_brightwellii.AAC.1